MLKESDMERPIKDCIGGMDTVRGDSPHWARE